MHTHLATLRVKITNSSSSLEICFTLTEIKIQFKRFLFVESIDWVFSPESQMQNLLYPPPTRTSGPGGIFQVRRAGFPVKCPNIFYIGTLLYIFSLIFKPQELPSP